MVITMDTTVKNPILYVVSDSAGETGEVVARAAAAQFHPAYVALRRFSFVSDQAGIDRAIEAAALDGAAIVFTLVIRELRDYLIRQASRYQIPAVDIMGPVISHLEQATNQVPQQKPGLIHVLNEEYFKKVEAVEFAVKYDDGRDSRGILMADIVLVGVSRTSKTPLSMFLAHKSLKVANVPLVPEIKPPDELFKITPRKIFGLTINPGKLNEIRKERLKAMGLAEDAAYANEQRIAHELAYSNEVLQRLHCPIIDVSVKAVEETASVILDYIEDRSPL